MDKYNLSKEPYKGVRDFYPEEMKLRNYLFAEVRNVVNSCGFEEYDASILEESDLYRAKTGEEIVNEQTYNFVDRGGREVTLRPEMTPSVARMMARKRKELVFPLRWFNIGRRYRYERMQKGRMREFWQLDCDLFGADTAMADVEILRIPYMILRKLQAEEKHFEIRINHRGLTNFILREYLALNDEQSYRLAKLIDRKAKMPMDKFEQEVTEIVQEKNKQVMAWLRIENLSELKEKIGDNESLERLKSIFSLLTKNGINNFRYDSTLMRGFDYYTGMVFEVFDVDKDNNRSIFGGGRYDDLVGIFGVEKVAGVGFGMGDVVIMDFLKSKGLLPNFAEMRNGIYICLLGENYRDFANDLANELRDKNVKVMVDLLVKKIGDQIKYADKNGYKYVICVGEDEMTQNVFKFKNLELKKEELVLRDDLLKMMS